VVSFKKRGLQASEGIETTRGERMRPGMKLFVSIVFFTVSLIGATGLYFASQGYGGRSTMNRPAGTIQRDIPGIDSKTPSTGKTATFALG
jgi:hypothetical protein